MEIPVEEKKEFSKLFHILVDSSMWSRLTPNECKVYIVLLRHAAYDIRQCYPSIKTIAKEAGIHPRNVSTTTDRLVERGLIEKHRRDRSVIYYLLSRTELIKILTCPENMNTDDFKTAPSERIRDEKGRFASIHAVD